MLRVAAIGLAAVGMVCGCCITPAPLPPPAPCPVPPCDDAGLSSDRDARIVRPPPQPLCDPALLDDFGRSCDLAPCPPSMRCFEPIRIAASVERGPDAGPATLEVVAFPGGFCSRPCGSEADCGGPDCGVCVRHVLAGRAALRGPLGGAGICRLRCTPGFPSCPEGQACDSSTGACLEACTSDEQCRITTRDTDGDGIADELVYEEGSAFACVHGRCEVPGRPVGDVCLDSLECDDGFFCLRPPGAMGRCVRSDCSGDDCGPEALCVGPERPTAASHCALACEIGADTAILGPSGHGQGCDPNFACLWTGDAAGRGACLPGNYNGVAAPNAGAPCVTDRDCFSPYGRGACLRPHERSGRTGICVVTQCQPGDMGLLPGVPIPDPAIVCDAAAGFVCRTIGVPGLPTACIHECETADACVPGWACTRLLDTPFRVCAPHCRASSDCGAGRACQTMDGTPCEVGGTGECYCR